MGQLMFYQNYHMLKVVQRDYRGTVSADMKQIIIITHSERFAAAVAGSGTSDLISSYNSILEIAGYNNQFFFELTQYRMGESCWTDQISTLRSYL